MKKIEEIKKKISPILKEYGVTKAAVFGSYAKEENSKESDIDILVKIEADISLLDFVELKQKLEDKLNKKVDLVEYQTIKPSLREEILNTQIPIL
ncbi:MAG: nucleotidyltransferase family protein [Minisyncoccales bacterium]